MLKRFLFSLILSSLFSFSINAQDRREPVELTFGGEIRVLTPVSFINTDSVVLSGPNQSIRSVNRYVGGYGFGGVVRIKLTDFWNLETGLHYTRRRYENEVTDPLADFQRTSSVRTSGYEIPLKGLVYIQMADKLFMNVALGVSADFYASDVETRNPDYALLMFKETWIRASAIGNVGLEYRTEEDGYFYLGANFHQSFGRSMSVWIEYERDRTPPDIVQTAPVDLSYFSIDFRYFFPPKKDTRPKVKYVKPNWGNR